MTILITSGCSFSETISPWISTWPLHLEKAIESQLNYHEGLGAQGNGMISREVIYRVSSLLKTHKAKDMLVGIMWSGSNRAEVFLDYASINFPVTSGQAIPNSSGVYNPYNWVDNSNSQGWYILDTSGNDHISKSYYNSVHHWIYSQIQTIEHILRVQWFLKLHNINYFMTTYTSEVFDNSLINNINVKYLYDQIDFDYFLPVEGEYEWCRDYSKLPFPILNDQHPSSEQHMKFTTEVIVPFVSKYLGE